MNYFLNRGALILTGLTILLAPTALAINDARDSDTRDTNRESAADIRNRKNQEAAAAAAKAADAARTRKENEQRIADIAAARKDREDAATQKTAADAAEKVAKDLLAQAQANAIDVAKQQKALSDALELAAAREQQLTKAEAEQKVSDAELVAARTEHAASRQEHATAKVELLNEKAAIERDKHTVELRERVWSVGTLGLVFTNILALISLFRARRSSKIEDDLNQWKIREIRNKIDSAPGSSNPPDAPQI